MLIERVTRYRISVCGDLRVGIDIQDGEYAESIAGSGPHVIKRFATYVSEVFRSREDASSKRTRTPSAKRKKFRCKSKFSVGRVASTVLE